MNIAIVGNGFDLRHKLKTSYSDFMKTIEQNNNIILKYYSNMNRCNGWFDFEHDLLLFFELLTKFKNSLSITENGKYYHIRNDKFVSSPETRVFYDTICQMSLKCFISSNNEYILIDLNNRDWHKIIIEKVLVDYEELKSLLKEYLHKQVDGSESEIVLLDTTEIDVIRKADKVYTFNYTNLLEQYDINNVNYVHGNLSGEIILGIPFSKTMALKEFQHIFKISQSINLNYNSDMIRKIDRVLHLYFIGLSFGESDHYYFQEIKDWIDLYFKNAGTGVPPITFHMYYHNEEAKLDFLNNLRIFMGEESFIRFGIEKRIKFHPYKKVD